MARVFGIPEVIDWVPVEDVPIGSELWYFHKFAPILHVSKPDKYDSVSIQIDGQWIKYPKGLKLPIRASADKSE